MQKSYVTQLSYQLSPCINYSMLMVWLYSIAHTIIIQSLKNFLHSFYSPSLYPFMYPAWLLVWSLIFSSETKCLQTNSVININSSKTGSLQANNCICVSVGKWLCCPWPSLLVTDFWCFCSKGKKGRLLPPLVPMPRSVSESKIQTQYRY